GYKVRIVMPRTQSVEKKDAVRLYGAELVEVDAVPYSNPENYVHYSRRLAGETGAVWANQFDNVANRDFHYKTTGPEIFEQTDGAVDAFTCAVGSGGTIGGVAMALRERKKDVKIALSDPYGSKLFSYVKTGALETEGGSITEGIGQGRVTANIEGVEFDDAYRVSDADALDVIFDLVMNEGLCLGGSAGINIAGAIKLAQELGPGHTVATILCDYGHRYASKLFNVEFLREKGLPTPPWLG
ncbi:MAG: pyridoxal-phosphate dependent enzyme, partial [Pseudomonadota bacterium]